MKRSAAGALVLMLCLGEFVQAQTPAIPENTTVPVVFEGETLAYATGKVGAFSPAERAVAIAERLARAMRQWELDPNTIVVQENLENTENEIIIGGRDEEIDQESTTGTPRRVTRRLDGLAIMVVTDQDARAAKQPRRMLANQYALRFREAIEQARDRHSLRWVMLGILKTILTTAALLVVLALIRLVGRRALGALETAEAHQARQESFAAVLTQSLCVQVSLLLRLLVWPAVILLFLIYVHLVLMFFPATAPLAKLQHDTLMGVFWRVLESVVSYLPNLVVIALIVLVTRYVLKVAATILEGFELGRLRLSRFPPDWARPTYKILRFAVLALMVVVLYPYLPGSDSAAFRGVSVFLGLLLSLGSGSVIANAMAGTIQTYMRALQEGDFVQIGDHVGTVIDKTLLVTRVRTTKNVIVTIPNSTTLTTPVRNYSVKARQEGVILYFSVSVGFDVPWRTVQELLLAATSDVEGVLSQPRPFVLQTAMTETYIRYELNVYSDQPARQAPIFTALHQNIQDRFREAGVRIMVPTYVDLLGDASARMAAATNGPGAVERVSREGDGER